MPYIFILSLGLILSSCASQKSEVQKKLKVGFIIHGGSGVPTPGTLTPEKEVLYREKLKEAVLAGHAILKKNGSSLDAVEAAVRILEDSPLFNAGKGAVFTAEGTNELDASIMSGDQLKAGAVAGLKHVKNPITLARKVMESSPHVMMAGAGAEKFAKTQGVEMVPQKYFWTKERWDYLQEIIKEEKAKNKTTYLQLRAKPTNRFGTVGAVAIDGSGNYAAGTSTGGMTYKRFGRIGDSPIIGAGTYAKNNICGISATGHGEYFIRLGVARDICALTEYKGLSLQAAADEVIHKKLQGLGGDGAVIGLDSAGTPVISYNSEGLFRAWIDENGEPQVRIYDK